jgi:hypothetical protein
MMTAEGVAADARDELTGDARTHLLFATMPLLRILRGDKREYLRRAWIANALHHTTGFAPMPEGRLPTDPREAALTFFSAAIQVARTAGIDGPDLVNHFNNLKEGGAFNSLVKSDDALEHAVAALMVLVAAKMKAHRP